MARVGGGDEAEIVGEGVGEGMRSCWGFLA